MHWLHCDKYDNQRFFLFLDKYLRSLWVFFIKKKFLLFFPCAWNRWTGRYINWRVKCAITLKSILKVKRSLALKKWAFSNGSWNSHNKLGACRVHHNGAMFVPVRMRFLSKSVQGQFHKSKTILLICYVLF